MLHFALRRQPSLGGRPWRCLQQVFQAPSSLKTTRHFHTPISTSYPLSRQASANKLLGLRSVTCLASRLCHANRPGNAAGDRTRHTKEGFSMKAIVQAPKPALYLGVSALIPFLAAPLFMAATQAFYPELAYAQMVYGASIVSFLGGARWGFAIAEGSPARPDWLNLGNGVVPLLATWLALLCRDNVVEGSLLVIMGMGLSLHYDLTLLPGYPAWFKAMRIILTLVASFSLVAMLTLKKFCNEKKIRVLQN